MSKVNLDALIPREDFLSSGINSKNSQSKIETLSLSQLLPDPSVNFSSIYHLVKKPDFQRETNEWDKERIAELIESFIEHSFIPSIILWENEETGNIYVIDGAHRLSAIFAYLNDDYGDRTISHEYYGYNSIPPAEIELGKETRTYIDKRIGSFSKIMEEGGKKADGIKKASFDVQMITGDVTKAEESFFRINQQGVILSPTERELCKSRNKPTCIATRAIMKGGSGTQYWKNFKPENQIEIKSIAEELHKLLFEPPYEESSLAIIKDHPLGGPVTIATPMVFNVMKIIKDNNFNGKEESDTTNGESTLNYLKLSRKVFWKMLSQVPGSIGLFPTIYFYSSGGKFIQSAFLGMFQLLVEKSADQTFIIRFTINRKRLENFLITYKILLVQINRKYGSKERSYKHMKWFFENLINYIDENKDDNEVLRLLRIKYDFINEGESEIENRKSNAFTKEQKIEMDIKSQLDNTLICQICFGRIHPLSKDFDHKIDLKHNGSSDFENAQITHVYCNNSKDKLREIGFYNDESA